MKFFKTMAAAAAVAVAFAGSASAASVSWTGPSNVVNESISFAGFGSDQLSSITGPGYFHAHTGGVDDITKIDINLNGAWTNIFTVNQGPSAGTTLLSSLPALNFSAGIVTGLRLSGLSQQTFHSLSTSTIFNFRDANVSMSTVPLPAALPLLLGSLMGLGIYGRRKNKAA